MTPVPITDGEVGKWEDRRSGELLSYVNVEERIAFDLRLWTIKSLVDEALTELSGDFAVIDAGRMGAAIPPKRPLRAMLQQARYSTWSARQLMELFVSDLLLRWFVGLSG